MDEIFGLEEIYCDRHLAKGLFTEEFHARHFSQDHDYVVVYARNSDQWVTQITAAKRRARCSVRQS
ncbi:MAG: hypothetical protein U5L11_00970 [Arhodomonas sp.]|nr:hypothetical protein [Arhodomonas sp.]